MTETKSCPACFKVRSIGDRTPLCASCIPLLPAKLQAEYATAYMSGDKAELRRVAALIVTAANSALDEKWQKDRRNLTLVGAR